MSSKVTLPSGATVTLKDPALLRVKDRKKVIQASDAKIGDLTKALALGDALIAMLVEEWSFDLLPPSVNLESLDELEIPDYDALVEATRHASEYLFPTLAKTEENEANPKALTVVSND